MTTASGQVKSSEATIRIAAGDSPLCDDNTYAAGIDHGAPEAAMYRTIPSKPSGLGVWQKNKQNHPGDAGDKQQ